MTRPCILIVDDNPRNLYVLEQTLAEIDADIVKAESGNRALAATFEHEFALAILDVQMPEMDGFELASLLRGEPRTSRLPIIFLTAAAGSEARVYEGYAAGAVDYILKPYDPPPLLAKARVFLELDRQRRELELHREALERRVVEASRSEERARGFFEHAPASCYVVAPDGLVAAANRAATAALGGGGVVGRPFVELFAPESRERARHLLDGCFEAGSVSSEPLVVLAAGGERRQVILSASVVRSEAGQALHAVAVQQDVTALHEALERRPREA